MLRRRLPDTSLMLFMNDVIYVYLGWDAMDGSTLAVEHCSKRLDVEATGNDGLDELPLMV